MSLLWRTEALVGAMSGRPVGNMPAGVTGISIDTRTLQPGDAFFAIKGDLHDGHDFATAAIKAGAALLIVAEGKLPALGRINAPMIVVPDVLAALESTGIAARARARGKIIAVTGSAGKTTTKEALRRGLSAVGRVHASDKSFNNHWGVPLTLARLPEDCEFAIFEVGMNHPGEIRQLVKFVRPHIALVTLIAAAHLGHFRSIEEIARAKAEIFEGVERGGHALINRDDRQWKLLDRAARDAGIEHVWGFGEHARSTFRLVKCQLGGESSAITVKMAGHELALTVGAPGRHMVQNVLGVLGAAYLAGANVPEVAKALGGLEAEQGRGKRHVLRHPAGGEFVLIDESYNANPASMRAALDLLRATPVQASGRRIAVLGDMLELGVHAPKLHASLAQPIVDSTADLVFLGGSEMEALAEALPKDIAVQHLAGNDEIKPMLLDAVRPGDVVMIKSSKSIGFSKLVDAMLRKFPAAAKAVRATEQIN
jgi:UDP-N-acetylmuramoyl-tripeptide--D-alanyl-D-alanine ligase